ncbi:MAG: hypothetical protein R3C40_02670 [Parvularculaceae bacterium]
MLKLDISSPPAIEGTGYPGELADIARCENRRRAGVHAPRRLAIFC